MYKHLQIEWQLWRFTMTNTNLEWHKQTACLRNEMWLTPSAAGAWTCSLLSHQKLNERELLWDWTKIVFLMRNSHNHYFCFPLVVCCDLILFFSTCHQFRKYFQVPVWVTPADVLKVWSLYFPLCHRSVFSPQMQALSSQREISTYMSMWILVLYLKY